MILWELPTNLAGSIPDLDEYLLISARRTASATALRVI
jgi:hypothetical protein